MLLKYLVVLCALIGLGLAAQSIGKPPPIPEKFKGATGCYIADLDEVIPFGNTKAGNHPCMRYSCSEQWIQYSSCGLALNPRTRGDPDKPYPACCAQ